MRDTSFTDRLPDPAHFPIRPKQSTDPEHLQIVRCLPPESLYRKVDRWLKRWLRLACLVVLLTVLAFVLGFVTGRSKADVDVYQAGQEIERLRTTSLELKMRLAVQKELLDGCMARQGR